MIVLALEIAAGRLRNGNATMLAARTAHGNGKLGLTLRDVTRHHDVEKLEPRIEELLRLGMLDHEVRHHCIEARECPHFGS